MANEETAVLSESESPASEPEALTESAPSEDAPESGTPETEASESDVSERAPGQQGDATEAPANGSDAPADEPAVAVSGDGASEDDEPKDGEPKDGAAKAKGKSKPKARKKKPVGPPPPPDLLQGAVEAVLLAAGDVIKVERLRDVLGLPSVQPVRDCLDAIQIRWAEQGMAVELEEVAGGVRVVTRPEYAEYVGRMSKRPTSDKLSRSLVETLSIVAYKQPVGRAEVERIRGVQAGEALRALLDRQLLRVVGRSDLPGRPLLYGTSQRFLTLYGLRDLKDLPSAKDLRRM